MQDATEQWCRQLLNRRFEVCYPFPLLEYSSNHGQDPEIARKVIQLLVTFSTKALSERSAFALSLLEYILNSHLDDNPSAAAYSEAVKDLERTCSQEMQKLAMMFPDEFMVRPMGMHLIKCRLAKCFRGFTTIWSARSIAFSLRRRTTTDSEWHFLGSCSL
jgi:hypothetical protein